MPKLLWDVGTAYDLFVSLEVLNCPADHGVRSAWAAGVRARVPASEREVLEQSVDIVGVPMHWVYTLPAPKDAETVLWSLGQLAPAERLLRLGIKPGMDPRLVDLAGRIAAKGSWDEADLGAFMEAMAGTEEGECYASTESAAYLLNGYARAAEFGERYLDALRAYYQAFFAEEEKRIRPVLQSALAHAQELAATMPLPDLLEELSQGLRFTEVPDVPELVLAPSFWGTPLLYMGQVDERRYIYLFGARPADAALSSEQAVPDGLLNALEALSDPTRLRILHYLGQEPLSPSELARRLRLRAPTVTHHLGILRLAGLVRVTMGQDKEKKRYAARPEAIASVFRALQVFLRMNA